MNILLTGSDGNLGTEIRRQAQAPVVGLGREGWQDLDTALAGVDTVLHAASDPGLYPNRCLCEAAFQA